jgi:hypothetical protein
LAELLTKLIFTHKGAELAFGGFFFFFLEGGGGGGGGGGGAKLKKFKGNILIFKKFWGLHGPPKGPCSSASAHKSSTTVTSMIQIET